MPVKKEEMFILQEILNNHGVVGFFYAFCSALGRGYLLNRPPQFSHKLIDAVLCGLASVIVSKVAVENGMSVWYAHACSFAFGALGFLVLHDFINGLIPLVKEFLAKKVNK